MASFGVARANPMKYNSILNAPPTPYTNKDLICRGKNNAKPKIGTNGDRKGNFNYSRLSRKSNASIGPYANNVGATQQSQSAQKLIFLN